MNQKTLAANLFLAYKLIRPILPISGGLATWIIAQSCGANSVESLAAAIAFALGTIGSSFYHYGSANWMYARKSERFKFNNPKIIKLVGIASFCFSLCIAVIWLPKLCILIYVFDAVAIMAYSAKLSSHWATKNILMSIICITPIVIGWQIGTETHPIIYWAIGLAFLAYLAREIIKDVKDIKANEGKRITLPMIFGIEKVLQISGILLLIAAVLCLALLQFAKNPLQIALTGGASLTFFITATILLVSKKAGKCETLIQASVCLLLLALW